MLISLAVVLALSLVSGPSAETASMQDARTIQNPKLIEQKTADDRIPAASRPKEETTLDTVEKGLKIAAYIVGALWVYFNYFRGRTYRPRLEVKLAGVLLAKKTAKFARFVVSVKNVGLSKVDIRREGTALRLLTYDPSDNSWAHQATVAMLEAHQWIEPGETVEEPLLLPVHSAADAVRVEAIIVSTKTMWETAAIFTESKEVRP